MKEHLNAAMRSFVCAVVCAALGALLIALMLALYDIDRTVTLAIGAWVIALAAQAIVNELLMAYGTTQLLFLLVNGALLFFASGEVVARTVFLPGSAGFPVLLRIFVLSSGFCCAYAAQKEPDSNVFVRCTDALIIIAALYLAAAFCLGDALHMPILSFALCAFMLAMLMTAMLRAGGESDSVIRGTGIGGWLVLAALMAFCLLITTGLLGVSTGHVESIVGFFLLVWRMITRIGKSALYALAWVLTLLAPQYKHASITPAPEADDTIDMSGLAMPDAPPWIVYVFLGAIAAAALLVLIVVIRALAGAKLTRSRTIRRRRRVTRKSHFLSALRALIASAAASIAFETAYRFGPPSVQRLYVLCVRTGRLRLMPKRKSETPSAYLHRYHSALIAQQTESSLDALAVLLDGALFGNENHSLSKDEYDHYARQIRSLKLPIKDGKQAK